MYIPHQILAEVARHHRAELLAIARDSRRSAHPSGSRRRRRHQQRAQRQLASGVEATPHRSRLLWGDSERSTAPEASID
jgi:hypothetical protein